MKKSDRLLVYEKYKGKCAYCGKQIKISEMQVDHIVSKYHGGNDVVENYNPACRRCNHYKRAGTLEHFREMLKTLHYRLKENYIFKVAMDYGIVELKPFDGTFHFEEVELHKPTMSNNTK